MDKFGGDGLMAVFGALITLKDHAIRAYLAAHGLQNEMQRVADDVLRRYVFRLQLGVGLNSG